MSEEKSKLVVGKVIAKSSAKTAKIVVERTFFDKIYHKKRRKHTKLSVHDENEALQVGDIAACKHSRPISKTKHLVFVHKVNA